MSLNSIRVNYSYDKSDEQMLLNPKAIVYVRKPTQDEIEHFKFNGFKIPKCLIGTNDGKEIKSYNVDFEYCEHILEDIVHEV